MKLRFIVIFERSSDGKSIASSIHISDVADMAEVLDLATNAAAAAFHTTVQHVSLQYLSKNTGMMEQAWYDPILGEGSDIDVVVSSSQWRVLLLGSLHEDNPCHEVSPITVDEGRGNSDSFNATACKTDSALTHQPIAVGAHFHDPLNEDGHGSCKHASNTDMQAPSLERI